MRRVLIVLPVFLLVFVTFSLGEETFPIRSVQDRNLVSERALPRLILSENEKICSETFTKRNFKNAALGYVTPWYHFFV